MILRRMAKLVIFDLDGTLLDTIGDLAAACDAALAAKGLPRHTPEACRRMVGNGIRNLAMRSLPEAMRGDDALVDEVRDALVDYYIDHIDIHTRPYEGMHDVVRRLTARGVKVAVASNKFQAGTEKLVRRFFPDIEFAAVCGQREGVPLKPDPQVDVEIMKAAEASAAECVHVGDSSVDIATAKAAGVCSVGVTWGFRPRGEIESCRPDHIADTAGELYEILERVLL